MADQVVREGEADLEVVDFADLAKDQRSLDKALMNSKHLLKHQNHLNPLYLVIEALDLHSILIVNGFRDILLF